MVNQMDTERLDRPGDEWSDIVDEQAARADRYRDDGWEVVELHPGDVSVRTPSDGDDPPVGFDVVVPGSEFETLRDVIEGITFDSYELFGDVESSMAVVLVEMKSTDGGVIVLYPLYYSKRNLEEVRDSAISTGVVHTTVRPLDQRAVVTFSHRRPELFFGSDGS